MKTFEISIPELGNAVGTLGWLSTVLEEMQKSLQVSSTKSGLPCLTYQHPFDKKSETEFKRYILVMPWIDQEHYQQYIEIDGMATVRAVEKNDYEYGVFKYLTPAAVEKFMEWRNGVVAQFKEQLESK